ncbi:hypothetical protein V2J56_14450 [Georgenia sp. MJ206]|uniref:hypothetical protein n=1 Tax=Georgenia wangjunii TaxID=3117730 RepID=UPI002F261D23
MHLFAYGSLLNPVSLSASLGDVATQGCAPASCSGLRRHFGVAFPNDGSQPDKAYYDAAGARPPVVRFADLRDADANDGGGGVNGVCVPVTEAQLEVLTARELRYDLADVTSLVSPYPQPAAGALERVVVFVGKPRFTREDDVARGVVPEAYLSLVLDGVRYWDDRCPGFGADFQRSTDLPAASDVVPLRRMDAAAGRPAPRTGLRSGAA